jgi:stage II sporulation protein D
MVRVALICSCLAAVLAASATAGASPFGRLAAAPPAPSSAVFAVSGRGWGHGVGMSQWGANGFAQRGFDYARILAHYYPGTQLGRAPLARVRVLLTSGQTSLRVGSTAPFQVRDGKGQTYELDQGAYTLASGLRLRVDGEQQARPLPGPLVFIPSPSSPLLLDGKAYRGQLELGVDGGRLRAINHVGLEAYLFGVVPDEMPHTWPSEALKAQAVVARSYALATLKPGQIYDLLADTRSQVYGGIRAEDRSTNLAVGATAGQVLWWNGRVATTFYHSTSGGRTAAITDVWPKARQVPYLVSRPDPYCAASPHYAWPTMVVRPGRLRLLRGARDVAVVRNGSGRVSEVVVRGRRVTRRFGGDQFRRALGLRSSWFQVGVLALDAPPGPAVYGDVLELRGVARGVRGAVVQRLEAGRWRQVALARVRPDGRFVARVRARGGSQYRLAAEEVAASAVSVPLAPRLEARLGDTGVLGVVRPAFGGRTVAIQRRDLYGWRTVARAWANASGSFRAELELETGDYRAYVRPLSGLAAAASRPFRVTVG